MAESSSIDSPELRALVYRIVRRILGAAHPDIEDPLHALAGRIAERRAIDAIRSAIRTHRRFAAWNEGTDSSMTTGDPFHARVLCTEVLARLPGIQLRTLLMRGLGGYSVAEISRSMGVSIETVRSRLRLARRSSR